MEVITSKRVHFDPKIDFAAEEDRSLGRLARHEEKKVGLRVTG
jgi:hypothetical protein